MDEDFYGTTDVGPCPYDDCNGTRQRHNSTSTPPDCSTESCTECSAGRAIDEYTYDRPEERRRRRRRA